jgi:GT2 family glycosyltransferase
MRGEEPMELSVLVSTHNRARDLARFLDSLSRMKPLPRGNWEVIVVDNNSSDDTKSVVERAVASAPERIRYVFEARRGKSRGLNAGLAAVQGRIVAFTDDDAVVRPEWAESIVQFFDNHPEAVCVGGRVELFNPEDASTSTRMMGESQVIGIDELDVTCIQIIGCNMAFRKEVLSETGAFDTDIGPGSKFGVAEDLDYLYRVLSRGYQAHYEPSIAVLHNHERRSKSDLDRLAFNYLTGRGAFYWKHATSGDRRALRLAYREMRSYVGLRSLRVLFDAGVRKELNYLRLLVRGALRYGFGDRDSSQHQHRGPIAPSEERT